MPESIDIGIVIPVYNEEGNIKDLIKDIAETLDDVNHQILFVDDGSTDQTLSVIKETADENAAIKFISLSRNFGHQAALKAGLDCAKGSCVVMMDGDLEHPPQIILKMVELWKAGSDIVVTRRLPIEHVSLKNITSRFFYRFLNFISDTKVENGSADFRLLDRRVVEVLKSFPEQPLFYRALVNWLGFQKTTISYTPKKRVNGKTKYSGRRMLDFSVQGITSFSVRPLRIASIMGIMLSLLAVLYGCYVIYIHLFTDRTVTGWTSLMVLITFLGGMQMIMIGVLGEYVGKIFMASKQRPIYLIKEKSLDE